MDILETFLALVIATLIFVLFYKNKIHSIELEWSDKVWPSLKVTGPEVKAEMNDFYRDMMKSVEDFRNHMRGDRPKYDREIVQTILEEDQFQLPEDFTREGRLHNTLRSLRTAGLIRPNGGGEWQKRKTVEKTLFCQKVLEQWGEKQAELWSPSSGETGSGTD